MKIRILVCTCVAAMALNAVPAWAAPFQAGTSTTVVKKSRKAAKEAAATENKAVSAGTQTAPGAAASKVRPKTVSDSEIAAAKASGKVWVNTESGVYHKGGQWYGATKQGKFMTEDDAIKAGYRAAKTK